jgi:ankyrin repeat protein
VPSLKDFQHNFSIFSEQSLTEMNWDNVVVAGSAALTPLLPIPTEHGGSKRSIRNYYHNVVAPASDVDLFLYGLSNEEAVEKIKQIERSIKDAILSETTTIRTKNAITIASQHPVRHVQIVLRIYKNISEILAGFDVDCSCVAYDGKQIWSTPRAITSLMTQVNEVDLTRRSPSYESRLSKYSHRGFEIHWPQLDRTRIDPTIFERSFPRTVGLARLLVLEKLPKDNDRANYNNQRRVERGRPAVYNHNSRALRGDMKKDHIDEIAEWVQDDQISNYHSFTIPYGVRFNARRIEKLLYTRDLLLNSEWNTKDRKWSLHRHPAFFGDAEHALEDCCGFCPEPQSEEERLVGEEESRHHVSGRVTFITDNPGRQAIGSFNPITDTDWTDMAYVGETARLFQAVVDGDLAAVKQSIKETEGIINRRDYTGRTVLHLATMVSTPEVVKYLLQEGAYLVPRIADGQTALHLAAVRGDAEIMQALHQKNEENKKAAEKSKNDQSVEKGDESTQDSESSAESEDGEVLDASDAESLVGSEVSAAASDVSAFLKVENVDQYMTKGKIDAKGDQEAIADPSKIEPANDILDANVPAWDSGCTPHHIATLLGNVEALEVLFKQFKADPSVPVKLMNSYNASVPRDAILSLVLALKLPLEKADKVVKILIANGARVSQANMDGCTAFQYFANHSVEMLQLLSKYDKRNAKLVVNHVNFSGTSSSYSPTYSSPIRVAIENRDVKMIQKLLDLGAEYEIDRDIWLPAFKKKFGGQIYDQYQDGYKRLWLQSTEQPVILAVRHECPEAVKVIIEAGADINSLNASGSTIVNGTDVNRGEVAQTLLDAVREKIHILENDNALKPSIAPQELESQDDLLTGIKPDTYDYWFTAEYIRKRKAEHQKTLLNYETALDSRKSDFPRENKLRLIRDLIESFKKLETYLVEKGAKTFAALHLNVVSKDGNDNTAAVYQLKLQAEQKEFARRTKESQKLEIVRHYSVENLLDSSKQEYLELFEAAWIGDLDRIVELTTSPRGEKKDQPPLKITARENHGHTPFDIAMLRGHVDVALAMLDIVQAQYAPHLTKVSYAIGSEDEDSDYEGSEDEESIDGDSPRLNLYERLPASVRNQFTIEDIGQISTSVKGILSPVHLLRRLLPLRSIVNISKINIDKIVDEHDADLQTSFYGYCMYKDDLELFTRFIHVATKYREFVVDSDGSIADADTTSIWETNDVGTAISLGKPQFLSKMISRTGAGISFTQLIKQSGVQVEEKSKYYQGLSVRGKKNKAWAQAHRNDWTPASLSERPLLLRACMEGSIEIIEWLLSDAPLRVYSEFSAANQENESVQALSKVKGGFEQSISDWLNTRRKSFDNECFSNWYANELQASWRYTRQLCPNGSQRLTS